MSRQFAWLFPPIWIPDKLSLGETLNYLSFFQGRQMCRLISGQAADLHRECNLDLL